MMTQRIWNEKEPANPLFAAAQSGDLSGIKTSLSAAGYHIDIRDDDGWSALHYAAYSKQPRCLRLLLEHGADPNAREQFGGTPLHWACEVGDLQSADELLRNGADVDACDHKSRTPLSDALFHRHWAIVELLAKAGADWFVENDLGLSPFDLVFGRRDAVLRDGVVAILGRTAPLSPCAKEALRKYGKIADENAG